jgi:hypothetical protein
MIYVEPGLYVVIEQLETELAPIPKPLKHGFSKGVAYRALGAFSLSETGEAYFILSNDDDEIWFISNRHLRTYQVLPQTNAFRITVSGWNRPAPPQRAAARNGDGDLPNGRRPML